jgi:pilus assembly protein CpaD
MKSRLTLLLSASLLAVGACATAPEYGDHAPSSGSDRHRIEVAQTGERMEIVVASGDATLSPASRAHVGDFASSYLRWGAGPIVMSTPSGGDNSDSAGLVAHHIRMALVESGVPYSAVAGSTYDGTGLDSAPVVLNFTRYEARAPDCKPLWSQDLAHQSNNQPYESFGCSTQANLAAMIENPRDLLQPRDEESRDSGRRGAVMNAYRQGGQTHASRSSDERVSISNAVQ